MRFVTKFWLCIGVVVAGYLFTVALDAILALRNEERMAVATSALFPATIHCQEARYAFERQLKLYEDGVVQGDPACFGQAAASATRAVEQLERILALPSLPAAQHAAVADLVGRHHTFTTGAATIYPALAATAPTDLIRSQAARLREESQAIQGLLTARLEGLSGDLRQGLGDAGRAMRHQRIAGVAAFVVIVVCSLVGVLLVMLGWTRRLDALLRASDRLAGGDHAAQLPPPRSDELGRLTASFAAMREAVQARARQLHQFNESLEDTVRARTSELSAKNLALSAEIAERQRAEHALRLLEAAVNQINEAVIVATPGASAADSTIVHVNPAFAVVTGWSEAEAQGRPLAILAGEATDPAAFTALFATAAAGGDAAAEVACCRRDGTAYPAEWHVSPIRAPDGAVRNLVAIQRDITERKRSQAELESANRQAGMAEIATGVLHNVGNVLNSVNVSTGLLLERLANPRHANLAKSAQLLHEGAAVPDFLRADSRGRQLPAYLVRLASVFDEDRAAMQAELRHLVSAVDHIKAIVGMQQSYAKQGTVLTPVRLVEVCEDALRLNQATLDRDAIRIERAYADLPAMPFDRHKIIQILVNLVANARQAIVEAAPSDRRLSIGLALAGGDRVRVWVADNGVGIPAENLARIFHHGFTTKSQGHGFGLHRCANAASEMGGRLTAASDGPGRGARFELELPMTRKPT